MKLGLIARADHTGLAVQTWEFAEHLNPDRILVIDVSGQADAGQHCNKHLHSDWYPGAMRHQGWVPPMHTLRQFLRGLDTVFTVETPYNPELLAIAAEQGVRTVIQPNYEFLDRRLTPSVWAAPSRWHWDDIPQPKTFLPVPIATERFTVNTTTRATRFLHIVGRPAVHDRNGTTDLLRALQHITAEVEVAIRCQQHGHVEQLLHNVATPGNVTVIVESGSRERYWDNYYDADVLVMPRRFGGLCLPVNEALGAGMPVIMPDIDPNNTWLPAEWLTPAHHGGQFHAKTRIDYYHTEPTDLAAKIDQLAIDDEAFCAAQQTALSIAADLSWNTLRSVYEKVLS